MKKTIARLLLPLGVLCAAIALLLYPTQASAGAKRGIGYCVDILIPSLFPFMALSVFVVKSGLASSLGRIAAGPCRILFGLPGSAAAAIVMSMVGGYPVGARAVAALCQEGEITPQEAARMLCFCVNSGPAFVLSVVGAGLLRSAQAGVLLLISQLSASLLLGILCSIGVTRRRPQKTSAKKGVDAAQALICSASDAARSMLSMCCFVILFAVLLDLLRVFVSSPTASTMLSVLLEVTGGCSDASRLGLPLWLLSFAIGWGGICVHFQILSSVSNIPIGMPRFMLFRLLHGILAGAITFGLCMLFPETAPVFGNTTVPLHGVLAGSVPAAAAIVGLCVLLLFQCRKNGNGADKIPVVDQC